MRAERTKTPESRWFLPLMAASGVTLSLTAPLEVIFVHEFWDSGFYVGAFMLSSAIGVIVVDVFGSRFVPNLDARVALTAGLALFGVACIGMGLAPGGTLLLAARVLQGLGGGMLLGAGLQAAVRVRPMTDDVARSLGRFNAAFLFGGAVGTPGGLLVAGIIDGRIGYQVAFVSTGVLSILVAAALAVALPRLSAPPGSAAPRIGIPRFVKIPGSGATLVLAMSGEFLRGGVLFTALPLAGAARDYSTFVITAAIALMAAAEIVVLAVAYRYLRYVGMVTMLVAAFGLGTACAVALALLPGVTAYLLVSALFGVSLAGATASLPVLIVAQVGESSAGVAKFRISAGIGILVGSVGCALLGTEVGITVLFSFIAVTLLASAQLARRVGRRMAAT